MRVSLKIFAAGLCHAMLPLTIVYASMDIIYKIIYVTGFGKTLRMGFFQKIEFDAWLISSIIGLTRVQVLG